MLLGKGDVVDSNTGLNKDFAIVVKMVECITDLIKGVGAY